jgi:hypothetical protein
MSEKYFQTLNLPNVPIVNPKELLTNRLRPHGYTLHLEPEKVLSPKFLNAINNLGVKPGFITLFTNSSDGVPENRWVHTDITSVQDPRTMCSLENIQWRICSFGINFEIFDNENTFYWYENTDNSKALMPVIDEKTSLRSAWLSGIHYGEKRSVGGVPDYLKHIATTTIRGKPTLIRTDTPHRTLFSLAPGVPYRVGLSVRFYENWTWNEALEIFKPLYADVME